MTKLPKYSLDDLLTVQDLASKLKVKVRTVRDWIARRKIPFTRFSQRVYVASGVVEEILQGNAVLPLSPHARRLAQGDAQTQGDPRK